MIDLLLADDEKLIREGLKTIIDWRKEGFNIVGAAKDGNECLELLNSFNPQVCIIDIRMPGISGLEVIKEVRTKGSKTHFIILSGYKDFGYVKQALSYHADNYLLKPIDEEELIESLKQVSKYITDEESTYPVNNERLIKSYFRSFLNLSTERLPEIEPKEITWVTYQFLLITIPKDQITKLESWLKQQDLGILLSSGNIYIILLKNYYMREAGVKTINNLFNELLKNKSFDGCLGSVVKNIKDLSDSLDDVEELMERRFFSTKKGITSKIYFKTYPIQEKETLDLDENIAIAQKLIEVGNEHQLKIILDDLSHQMINEKYNESMVKEWYCKLTLGTITSIINSNKLSKTNIPGNSEIIMEIQSCSRLYELEEKISNILFSSINRQDIQTNKTLIKRMKFIVENHYMENLKLKELSQILNYNSAYLGKVFKSENGESFSIYLDKYRINRAKEFLQEGYMVYQAAEKVGYTYVDYFHTKFKKYTGMSPLEYRKQNY